MKTTVCIAYPNKLFCEGLGTLLRRTREYQMLFAAESSDQFLQQLKKTRREPDICLFSPELCLHAENNVLQHLQQRFPNIKSIAFSSATHSEDLFQLLQYGVKAHISQSEGFDQLLRVLDEVRNKGYFFDAYLDQAIAQHFNRSGEQARANTAALTPRQSEFVVHCCSDMSFKEIADKMGISIRTADKFREVICQKLNIKTRVGIVMYAVDHGIYVVKNPR